MVTKRSALLPVVASLGLALQVVAPVYAQNYGNNTMGTPGAYTNSPAPYNSQTPYNAPQSVYIPAGLTLNAKLSTAISTDVAKPGDLVQATLNEPIMLGNATIPAGTQLSGTVSEASSGGFFGRSGKLTLKFDRMRTLSGVEAPMAAHIVGTVGKYNQNGQQLAGETAKTKVGQALIRTAIGAGAGAALGTAVGAIAGKGTRSQQMQPVYMPYGHSMVPVGYQTVGRGGAAAGAGRGAWSGAAIGGGVGLANSVLMRKGKEVIIPTGTNLQLQLDAPINLNRQSQYGVM